MGEKYIDIRMDNHVNHNYIYKYKADTEFCSGVGISGAKYPRKFTTPPVNAIQFVFEWYCNINKVDLRII